jgi:hypothetical protein
MPDFGIFRGFNEKLFGDKLYAGQLPINLGLIGSEEVRDFDIDAQAFFDRVTAAGGTLSNTEKFAIDTLVRQMKLDGIWTKMKAIYPMVGASAAACAQNLKSSSFTGTFNGGVTYASTGVKSNGTSGWMNTSLTPSTHLSLNNTHISVYIRDNSASNNPAIANTDSALGINELSIYPRYGNNDVYTRINAASSPITTSTNSQGMHIGSRIVSTQIKYYKNNTSFSLNNNSNSLTTGTMPLLAFRYIGNIITYYSGECAFASIGDGLTDTESSNFYTAVQAFQTTLSREV